MLVTRKNEINILMSASALVLFCEGRILSAHLSSSLAQAFQRLSSENLRDSKVGQFELGSIASL